MALGSALCLWCMYCAVPYVPCLLRSNVCSATTMRSSLGLNRLVTNDSDLAFHLFQSRMLSKRDPSNILIAQFQLEQ